jgi:hypothetical protein
MDLSKELDELTAGHAARPEKQEKALRALASAVVYYHRSNASGVAYNRIRNTLFSKGNSDSITKRHMAAVTGWCRELEYLLRQEDQSFDADSILSYWQEAGIESVSAAYFSVRKQHGVKSQTDEWLRQVEASLRRRVRFASPDQLARPRAVIEEEACRLGLPCR